MVIARESQSAPRIQALATALPPYYVDQPTLTAALSALWQDNPAQVARFERIQRALGIRGRYLPLRLDEYAQLDSFAKCNDAWLRLAPDLAERAVRAALDGAGAPLAEPVLLAKSRHQSSPHCRRQRFFLQCP